MISYKRRAIFLHIPKCGGSTIEYLLIRTDGFAQPDYSYTPRYKSNLLKKITTSNYYKLVIKNSLKKKGLYNTVKIGIIFSPYLYKPILKLNSAYDGTIDEYSGFFRKGVCRRYSRSIHKSDWDKFFKFTFVRNPYDRLVSAWSFFISCLKSINNDVNFETFVYRIVRGEFKLLTKDKSSEDFINIEWHILPQTVHIYDESGNLLVDFVGHLENFQSDLNKVCEKLKIRYFDVEKIRENSSNHSDYKDYYTPELKRMVYEHFKNDFKLLGYDSEL